VCLIQDTLPVTHPEINSCSLHISKKPQKSKRANPRKRFALLKNDITTILRPQKRVIYSGYLYELLSVRSGIFSNLNSFF